MCYGNRLKSGIIPMLSYSIRGERKVNSDYRGMLAAMFEIYRWQNWIKGHCSHFYLWE